MRSGREHQMGDAAKKGQERPRKSPVSDRTSTSIRGRVVSAAVAAVAFHPIDTIKVRKQLGHAPQITNMLNKHGIAGIASFYKGLSAGLLRQVIHTSVQSYSDRALFAKSSEFDNQKLSPAYRKLFWLPIAAAVGAFACNPFSLAATRMQGDATLPAALRRNYKNVLNALHRVASDEGFLALWKGAGPSILKTMGISMGLFASLQCVLFFSRHVKGYKENYLPGSIILLGILPPACSKPFDYVKTQIQMMQRDARGRYPYTGPLDCAKKTLKFGGPLKFYTGFVAYCFTFFPKAMLGAALSKQLFQGLEVSIRM